MGKLYFITGDIIENSKDMDAIVNAQNKYMINGSGICGLIYRNAGPKLLEYCKKNYSENMEVSEVRVTPGFNLNMDIIHVYAPIYNEWKANDPILKLEESYINLLNSIKENKYKNVIIPSIGTGAHGYNHSEVSEIVVKCLYNYVRENDVNLYFINRFAIATNEYFIEFLKLKDFNNDEIMECLLNETECYKDFIEDKEKDELTLYEKYIKLKVTGEKI